MTRRILHTRALEALVVGIMMVVIALTIGATLLKMANTYNPLQPIAALR